MFRTVVIAVAIIGFTAHTASAQQLTYQGVPLRQALSTPLTFQVAPAPRAPATSFAQPKLAAKAQAAAPKTSTQSKSFWHTPWPYVIAGAAAATIIVIAHNSGSSTTSGGY